jgi:hypothetical protein
MYRWEGIDYLSGCGQGQVAGFYGHNNEPLHSVKCEEFLAKLKNYELGKKDSPLRR